MNKRQAKKNVRKHHRKLWKNVKDWEWSVKNLVPMMRHNKCLDIFRCLAVGEELKHDCFLPWEYVIDEEENL